MSDFDENLEKAIKRVEGKMVYDMANKNQFYKLYPFATENIKGYIHEFELKNKSLLTVGSSGDQVFNALYLDCHNVTLFDINAFSKYYFFLKMASIISLDLDEFLLFLHYKNFYSPFKDNYDVLDKKIFRKVERTLEELDVYAYLFWKELFRRFDALTLRKKLFSLDEDRTYVLQKMNLYLENENNYLKLRDKLEYLKINFIQGNVLTVGLLNNFDNIWLSNIAQYLTLDEIKKMVIKMDQFLNMGGKMLISYIYQPELDISKQEDNIPDLYYVAKVMNELEKYQPYLKQFIGVNGIMFQMENVCDGALIYTKRTKF